MQVQLTIILIIVLIMNIWSINNKRYLTTYTTLTVTGANGAVA